MALIDLESTGKGPVVLKVALVMVLYLQVIPWTD